MPSDATRFSGRRGNSLIARGAKVGSTSIALIEAHRNEIAKTRSSTSRWYGIRRGSYRFSLLLSLTRLSGSSFQCHPSCPKSDESSPKGFTARPPLVTAPCAPFPAPTLSVPHIDIEHVVTMASTMSRLAQLALGATGFGLAATTWFFVVIRLTGRPTPFAEVALFIMPFWFIWAAYLPAVLWMANRYPIQRGQLLGSFARHTTFASILALSHTTIRITLQPQFRENLETNPDGGTSLGHFLGFAVYEAPVHLFIYVAIMGVTHIVGHTRRLHEREVAAAELASQLAQAQIQALRMQLNPHFLFNALNGVATLVRERKHDQAVQMLSGLSNLLRCVLDESEDQEVPLWREMDFVAKYLEIEQVRFPDRLTVEFNIAPEAGDALVPNLLLQPIVENAIHHGLEKTEEPTGIAISAKRDGGMLELSVVDDGPGFVFDKGNTPDRGIGIENTRTRLAKMYEDNFSLRLESHSPRGATVSIVIPFRAAPPSNREA